MKHFIAPLLFLVALTACQQSAPAKLSGLQYNGPAFQMAADAITVEKAGDISGDDVQARYNFPTRLDSGIEEWSKRRLLAQGGGNRLQLDILESSVTEQPLPVTKGFSGLFQNEQSTKFTAKLKIELKLYTPNKLTPSAGVISEASRSTTVSESASFAERQQAFNDLVIGVLEQIDNDMSRRIPQHFGPYLLY